MATFLWACFDGGGNVPPSVGIARELRRRGHEVVLAGRPELAPRVTATGLPVRVLASSYRHADRYAWHPRGRLFSFLTSPAVGDELLEVRRKVGADACIVDAMFGAALDAAPGSGVPTAVMLHTFLHRTVAGWQVLMGDQADARERAGLGSMPDLRTLWGRPEALHVNALEAFDSPPVEPWPTAAHGAPVLEPDARARPLDHVDVDAPLVLVSFSTAVAQSSIGKLQRTLDALGRLPVRAVATVGAVPTADLRLPANATAVAFADHNQLLRRAAAVVTHGGHGTAMRALAHGVPTVCLTGRATDQEGVAALDQPQVAAFLAERGVGVALDAEASPTAIRAALRHVLDDPGVRSTARELAEQLRGSDGAALAADRVEALLGARVGAR